MNFKNLEIFLDGVRCFSQPTWVPVRPVTILVGENSSGKSTVLALVRIVWDVILSGMDPNDAFNEAPFAFGSFEHIVTYVGGRSGKRADFRIGLKFDADLPRRSRPSDPRVVGKTMEVVATFIEIDGASSISRFEYLVPGVERLTIKSDSTGAWTAQVEVLGVMDAKKSNEVVLREFPTMKGRYSVTMLIRALDELVFSSRVQLTKEGRTSEKVPVLSERQNEVVERLWMAIRSSPRSAERPYAFAPIRSSPRRTYDPVGMSPSPEGGHVPSVLAELAARSPEKWAAIRKELELFGVASGLFEEISVQRKGKKLSDPFQVGVTHGKRKAFNLADVGYGVSQVLPIIFELLAAEADTFLLQQPEVHLHPRAQAALGSFIMDLFKRRKKHFVIETHSDYLLDRIRMDIRDRYATLAGEVLVLFFDSGKKQPAIYPMEIDSSGEFKVVPEGYRAFFMAEEQRFLVGQS